MIFMPLFSNVLSYTKILKFNPLKGAYIPAEKPNFNFKKYYSGRYKPKFEQFVQENQGFHELLVRINNQVSFSLFSMTEAAEVVIGKENYLFSKGYIEEYYGRNFKGRNFWDEEVQKIKYIQDELSIHGVTLLIIFEPGKANFFPEFIPDRLKSAKIGQTNYQYLLESLKKEKISHIDFNSYFASIKDTVKYPLYPQCGIHWSAYGVGIAMDSIIHKMEMLKNRKMIDFGWRGVDVSDSLQSPDYDLGELMNLVYPIPQYKMAYPRFWFKEDSLRYRPKVITVADSYYWCLYLPGITSIIYGKDRFWDYYKKAYEPNGKLSVWDNKVHIWNEINKGRITTQDLNQSEILNKLFDSDFVVIMATESNYARFGFGFFSSVYALLKDYKKAKSPVAHEK